MALPFDIATTLLRDDLSKRARKPYTITKCRESWTEPEHDKFLEAIQLFDRDWKKIKASVGSKTVIQRVSFLLPGCHPGRITLTRQSISRKVQEGKLQKTIVAVAQTAQREHAPTKSSIEEHNHFQLRVLPDFGQVYNFIGSVFDPKASGHLQRYLIFSFLRGAVADEKPGHQSHQP